MLRLVDVTGERIRLFTWLTQLERFRENQPLTRSIRTALTDHLNYFYENNRNYTLFGESSMLKFLPETLKRALVVGYVYDDLISDFRGFFRPDLYLNSDLLLRLCHGMRPRFIHGSDNNPENQSRSMIFKEGDEVQEMFFIQKGEIGIGYTYYMNNAVN